MLLSLPELLQTFTQTYTITQADVDAGSVLNTATAAGVFGTTPVSDTDDETVTGTQTPELTVTKTAAPNTYTAAGEVITYTILVENTGNVTVTAIAVTDPLTGLSQTIASLAPGASQTFTQTYTITQADVDAGSVLNTATAAGVFGTTPVSDTDDETVQGTQTPELTVTKTAAPNTYTAAGEVITYTILVENTGNVTVTAIAVTDPLTGLSQTIASLAPGASQTFTQTYTITQADVDAGSVLNTATAAGVFGTTPVSDTDDETVTGTQTPELTVTKTAAPNTYTAAGEVITYTILVENTGNVTVTAIAVTDPLTGLSQTIASLAPGASQTFTQTYTITQADVDAGSVLNTATAAGVFGTTPVSDTDDETVTGTQTPELTVTKTAAPNTYTAAGEVITYTILVENTGNVTVTAIAVTDPLTGLSQTIASLAPGASQTFTQTYTITQADVDAGSVLNTATAAGVFGTTPVSDTDDETVTGTQTPELTVTKTAAPNTYTAAGEVITYTILVENTGNVTVTAIAVTDPLTGLSQTIASLAPGASQTFTQTYTITQADVDAGSVLNTATAAGVFGTTPVSDTDDETVTGTQTPELTVTKTAAPNTYTAAGEVITYTILVENTGNVTVTAIAVTDPLTGLSQTIASLAPGASQTFTQTYTITQADVDAGSVLNTATAAGVFGTTPVSDTDDETVTGTQTPELTVTKTAAPNTYTAAGEVITYTILVENTGNVTVTAIAVTDPLTGLSQTIASLAPGALRRSPRLTP